VRVKRKIALGRESRPILLVVRRRYEVWNCCCSTILLPRISSSATRHPKWIRMSILAGAGCFIFAPVASAVFDHRIRVLHVVPALIYVLGIMLTRKRSACGFGGGFLASGPQYVPLPKRVFGL
jgi:hypothetical protein